MTEALRSSMDRIARVPTPMLPADLDIEFEGFGEEAFLVLDRLRENPHIEQYKKEKPAIKRLIKEPFKQYRDDLVVNLVLPNRLDLETERNVFSRFLKNDFGAGGCHHHYWLAFYRPHRTRITDIQLAHSLSPEGLRIAVYAGKQARDAFVDARSRIVSSPNRLLSLLNPLLQKEDFILSYQEGTGSSKTKTQRTEPIQSLPDAIRTSTGIAVHHTITRDAVIEWQDDLVRVALERVARLWPIYRFLLDRPASK